MSGQFRGSNYGLNNQHGFTTATVSSWVHLIPSSNLRRKFKTLLQDSFSWHPATTTQHLSWKKTALASHFRTCEV